MKAEIKINTMIVDLVKWKIGRANDKNTTLRPSAQARNQISRPVLKQNRNHYLK